MTTIILATILSTWPLIAGLILILVLIRAENKEERLIIEEKVKNYKQRRMK